MKRQFVTVPYRRGACHDRQGHREVLGSLKRQGEGGWGREQYGRESLCADFVERNGQGRVSRFRIMATLNNFSQF